ncbi:MAG: TIGR04282 family arsenosugar biosynthesis glycosyltransferase [Panacagrimonas sp.]
MNPLRIVIFAKSPNAGQVKTRLIPALGAAGAAALAKRMLRHAVTQALLAGVGEVELCRWPADDPLWPELDLPDALRLSDQGEGDLGERMARASARVLAGGQSVLLIGTDCPTLDAPRLRVLAAALTAADAAIIPATDGGYVALALNRFDPELFRDIAWSTDTVATITLRRLATLGWSVRQFPPEHDIDEPADLEFLPISGFRWA